MASKLAQQIKNGSASSSPRSQSESPRPPTQNSTISPSPEKIPIPPPPISAQMSKLSMKPSTPEKNNKGDEDDEWETETEDVKIIPKASPTVPKPPTSFVPTKPTPAPAPPLPVKSASPRVPVGDSRPAPRCTSCGKTVAQSSPEELIALQRTWHQACFVCGGTGDKGCRKTLSRDAYVSHENQPYCKRCHTDIFGTHGLIVGANLATLQTEDLPENRAVHGGVAVKVTGATGDRIKASHKVIEGDEVNESEW